MTKTRNLLTLLDLSVEELDGILQRSKELKRDLKQGAHWKPLADKSIGLIFEKRSTRTRVSFEVGIFQLGAQMIYLSPDQMQLSRGEPIKDTARVLSRYLDALVVRGNRHQDLEEMAKWSDIPLVNALTDRYHPCQIAADLFTLAEAGIRPGKMKFAFIGDPNNVFNSWINASAMLGFELRLACPKGYKPDPLAVKLAAKKGKPKIKVFYDPFDAAKGADVLYTDVWVSMGQEHDQSKRRRKFKGFQVNRRLLSSAGKSALVLHCLPAHRGEEITDEAMEAHADLIFTQAENRLHAQKAILEFLVGRGR